MLLNPFLVLKCKIRYGIAYKKEKLIKHFKKVEFWFLMSNSFDVYFLIIMIVINLSKLTVL